MSAVLNCYLHACFPPKIPYFIHDHVLTKYAECKTTESNTHGVSTFSVIRVSICQHSHTYSSNQSFYSQNLPLQRRHTVFKPGLFNQKSMNLWRKKYQITVKEDCLIWQSLKVENYTDYLMIFDSKMLDIYSIRTVYRVCQKVTPTDFHPDTFWRAMYVQPWKNN